MLGSGNCTVSKGSLCLYMHTRIHYMGMWTFDGVAKGHEKVEDKINEMKDMLESQIAPSLQKQDTSFSDTPERPKGGRTLPK